jgi:hypothetical protein
MAANIKAAIKPNIDSILALLEIVIDEKELHEVRLEAADTYSRMRPRKKQWKRLRTI